MEKSERLQRGGGLCGRARATLTALDFLVPGEANGHLSGLMRS